MLFKSNFGSLSNQDKDQKDEPRRRYDGVHSELLANTSSSKVVSMSERVIKFVHKQIVILALEEVDSQSGFSIFCEVNS